MSSIKFNDLSFDSFKQLALDDSLTKYEKIGFPNSYREGQEENIFIDISSKLTLLSSSHKNVIDIGPGCSDLPKFLINCCRKNNHQLTLIDSKEMLAHINDESFITKIPGSYPICAGLIDLREKVDIIICYSVFHYIFFTTPCVEFIDRSLSLLAPGGQMLIGDIPNISMRKRFFSSSAGKDYHKKFMNVDDDPDVIFNNIELNQIDDSVMFYIAQRARLQGFNAYIVPQDPKLPMANRREDILICRP